ncbi:hypothetical protein B0H13DRAFT_2329406 [Mycena leptocephala]|nr:hypothetical protein B0H13DRAFT_2329406 [Mycena leptocephala]
MKLALSTILVVLTLAHNAHGFFLLCILAQLFVNRNACWGGWGGGGQPSIGPAPPPPPPPCRPGEYRPAGGDCQSVIGKCDQPPNTQIFAHPERPCGCQPPSAVLDLKKTICNTPPPNGAMFCETATNGLSSQCKVQCDFGFKWNPKSSKCIRDNLDGCTPPEDLASGPPGKGCVCLQPTDPAVSVQKGQKCGEVPYFDPADQAAGLDPPGRMICMIDPNDITNSMCVPQCIANYKRQGQSLCVPAGL